MKTKLEIAKNWLPRYTGTQIKEFGDFILLRGGHGVWHEESGVVHPQVHG